VVGRLGILGVDLRARSRFLLVGKGCGQVGGIVDGLIETIIYIFYIRKGICSGCYGVGFVYPGVCLVVNFG
jgi:hypothetical protein